MPFWLLFYNKQIIRSCGTLMIILLIMQVRVKIIKNFSASTVNEREMLSAFLTTCRLVSIPFPSKMNDKDLHANSLFSVQFSCSLMSNCLWPHELQHSRLPCPSPTPGVHPNPGPLSRWCHLTISSSVIPFSSCPQSFPASGSFQMSQLVASGGQSIGVSASTSILPVNTQDWCPLGWTGWISLQSKNSQESSPTPQCKSINSSVLSFLYSPTLTSIHD